MGMTRLVKPPRLEPGAVVAVVAPASAPPDPRAIDHSVAALNSLGYKPLLGRHVRNRRGFLAGTDRERSSDLMAAFLNPKVGGILCVRGGYGSGRLLPLLDYRAIRAHPKVLAGYSDITSLHCALHVGSGLVSFHGPMLNSDFIRDDLPRFTLLSFQRAVSEAGASGSIVEGYRGNSVRILRKGKASGRLIGGNLSLLCSLVGTPWECGFRGAILFFEDVAEVPYRFDRMLTQLLNAGRLAGVSGIAVGVNANCVERGVRRSREYRQTLEDVLRERLLPLKVPMVTGLPFGHIRHNATLPFGVRATLDGNEGDLRIDEPAVA